jgi:[ribosomal protein S18]-alanine N-acetyltransferase
MYYYTELMVEDDIRQVQEVERESFPTPWSANTYRRELRTPDSCRYIVARSSDQPPPPRSRPEPAPPRMGERFASLLAGLFGQAVDPPPRPLVGYAGLWLALDEAHVTTIAVAPQHRGRSVGELLLNGLIDQALDLQADRITLEVRVSNVPAQGLYAKYGFVVAGKRSRYYTDNGEDALIMTTESIRSAFYQSRLSELRVQLFARLRAQAGNVATYQATR